MATTTETTAALTHFPCQLLAMACDVSKKIGNLLIT
jgi:hypothetical protein